MVADGNGMVVKWNEEDVRRPRFSEWGITSHMADVGKLHEKFSREDAGRVKELMKKYVAYGNIVRPGGQSTEARID
jgi:hypothetical protein